MKNHENTLEKEWKPARNYEKTLEYFRNSWKPIKKREKKHSNKNIVNDG